MYGNPWDRGWEGRYSLPRWALFGKSGTNTFLLHYKVEFYKNLPDLKSGISQSIFVSFSEYPSPHSVSSSNTNTDLVFVVFLHVLLVPSALVGWSIGSSTCDEHVETNLIAQK